MYYCTNAAADLYGLAQEKNGSYFFFLSCSHNLSTKICQKVLKKCLFQSN